MTTKLEICWRNPNVVSNLDRLQRRQRIAKEGDCALYFVEQFVNDGNLGHWETVSGYEVLAGGEAKERDLCFVSQSSTGLRIG